MKQLMVRGDMVVSIYEADKENYAVTKSRYYKQEATAKSNIHFNENDIGKRRKGDHGNKISPAKTRE